MHAREHACAAARKKALTRTRVRADGIAAMNALIVALALALPQDPAAKKAGSAPLPKHYTVTPNGLVLPAGETAEPGARVRSDFDAPIAAPVKPSEAPARESRATPASAPVLDLGSPLLDVLQRVGHVSDLAALGGVVARMQIHVYDAHGVEIGTRELTHEADLAEKERDRLTFGGGAKTYGRDGAAVWVLFHAMLWPSLEDEARDELAMHGLLLRAPWAFADPQRFVVFPKEHVVQDERRLVRIRVEQRGADAERIGPREQKAATDAYELLCPQDSMEPSEVRIRRASGASRTIKLLDWRTFGGVRMPTRRVFLSPDGVRALEIVITRLDVRQTLAEGRFRPAR